MISIKQKIKLLTLLTALSISNSAIADTETIYSFDITNPPGSSNGGKITSLSLEYNETQEKLAFSSSIQKHNNHLANGFWLVLSDGPNPKNNVDEYAIFYGDATSGTLTSYVYDGVNSSGSWNTRPFIESFALSVDNSVNDLVTFNFAIDVAGINSFYNSPDWDGAAFNEKVGIWYHPIQFHSNPTYNQDGSLSNFPGGHAGWYDTGYKDTVKTIVDIPDNAPNNPNAVPEPSIILLMLSGLSGLFFIRRRSTYSNSHIAI